jgi:ABC-2 type transport system permease protein
MSAPEATGATGVIHDIGYQRYTGPRLGQRYATRSLFWHGVRGAYGIGRGAWAKVLPMGLLALACIAALVLVIVSSQLGNQVLSYVGVAFTFTYAATVFVAIVAPELASADLRHNLLSLYLSRPLRRADYALARLAALATAVFVLLTGPMLVMFVGMSFASTTGLGGVLDQATDLFAGLVAAIVHSALLAALALPLAALSGRRVFATGMIIAAFLLTAPVSAALREMDSGGTLGYLAGMLDPVSLLNGVDKWLFGEGLVEVGSYGSVYGLVTLALAAAGTGCAVWRYRRVKS